MLVELAIGTVVAVVGYHYIDKENFYSALIESKDTFKLGAIATKEAAITGKKGFQASKSVYKASVAEHEIAYARAGKDYHQDRFAKDRAKVKAVKDVFKPVQDSFDEIKASNDKLVADIEIELAKL